MSGGPAGAAVGLLKPSVVIRRGPRGYGFTLRAIRVYYGESVYYTLHHLVVVSCLVYLQLLLISWYKFVRTFRWDYEFGVLSDASIDSVLGRPLSNRASMCLVS